MPTRSYPTAITIGPGGDLWFGAGAEVGRITTTGSATVVAALPLGSSLGITDITLGPDGNLWATGDRLTRITPIGQVTQFDTADSGAPHGIAVGPDGNIWYTMHSTGQSPAGRNIWRITPAGVQTFFPLPTPGADARGIAVGSDGTLWFTEETANNIGRITTAGAITEFSVPRAVPPVSDAYVYNSLDAVNIGADGNIWFTDTAADKIGRIGSGGVISEFQVRPGSGPTSITAGPDGNIWLITYSSGIVRMGNALGSVALGPGSGLTASPGSVAADGKAAATVTLMLVDSSGAPLSGRSVTLSSSRGSADVIIQPPPTNAAGRTTGTITSSLIGQSTITALDVTDRVAVPGSVAVNFVIPSTRRAIIYIGGIVSSSDCGSAAHQLPSEGPAWLHPYLQSHAGVTDPPYYFSYANAWCAQGHTGLGENGDRAFYIGANTCQSLTTTSGYLRELIRRITDKAPGMKVTLVGHSQGGLLASYTVGALQAGAPGLQDRTFVRDRIASVVTFDSFPHGFLAGGSLLAEYGVINFFQTCGFPPLANPSNYDAWPDSSPYAQLAKQAGDSFDGYRVKIYTLAADLVGRSALDFSIGGLDERVTTIDGQVGSNSKDTVHYRVPSTAHATIWDPSLLDSTALAPVESLLELPAQQLTTCAVLLAETCTITRPTVSALSVGPSGGASLTLTGGSGILAIPAGAVSSPTILLDRPLSNPTQPTGALKWAGTSLRLDAIDASLGASVTRFTQPLTLTLTYQDAALQAAGISHPKQLGIYYLDSQTNAWQPVPSATLDIANHSVTAAVNHFTEFALLADVTPPTTTASLSGTREPAGSYLTPVLATLTGADLSPGSGLAASYYQLVPHGSSTPSNTLPGAWYSYTGPFSIQATGDSDLYAFSVDNATNAEVPVLVGLIVTLPTVTISGAPTASITLGTSITLAANVTHGGSPFTYAWTRNGAPFGTTGSINDTPADDATYAVTITDAFGLQSNTAQVTIAVTSSPGGGDGCGNLTCPPPPGATPEVDSVLLFVSGLASLWTYGLARRRRRTQERTRRH